MKKKTLAVLFVILVAILSALAGHIWTMHHLTIETDGDGDSAIIEVAGNYWFTGINGLEPGMRYMGE